MKFVCGECQAKYQIPDERVAGRKLKIRCRKCGAAIHLRGEHASVAGESTPTIEWHVAVDGQQHGPYPTEQMATMLRDGDLGWDASVWRDGYGEWKDADASDTLVRAVAAVAETRYSAPPGAATRSSSPSIVPDFDDEDPTRMVQTALPDEELPTRMVQAAFPDEELPTRMVQGAPQAARQASVSPVSGLAPARRPASVSPAAGLAPARARSASVSPAAGLAPAQARSVSVAPIAAVAPVRALASIAPVRAPAPAAAFVPPPAPAPMRTEDLSFAVAKLAATPAPDSMRAGYASGEGSGLIDIRALAALTQTGGSRPAPMPAVGRARATTPTDVMVPLGAPSSPFGNIDSLAPFERPQRSSKALPIAIVIGSSIIAAAAFLAVFLTRQEAAATVAAAEPATAPVVAAAAALPEPALAAAVEPATEPAAAAEPAAALAAAAVDPQLPDEDARPGAEADLEPSASRAASPVAAARTAGKAKASGKAAKGGGGGGGAAKAKASADDKEKDKPDADDLLAAPAEKPAAPAPEKPSIDDLLAGNDKPAAPESKPKPAPVGKRSIDELLDGAVDKKGGASAASAAAPSGGGNLPETPGRDEVKSTMQGVESDVRACAEGQTLDAPAATVAVTVTGSTGRVQSVRVTGNQGAVGSCIARVVRGAKFSPFSKPQFTFNFPYKLK